MGILLKGPGKTLDTERIVTLKATLGSVKVSPVTVSVSRSQSSNPSCPFCFFIFVEFVGEQNDRSQDLGWSWNNFKFTIQYCAIGRANLFNLAQIPQIGGREQCIVTDSSQYGSWCSRWQMQMAVKFSIFLSTKASTEFMDTFMCSLRQPMLWLAFTLFSRRNPTEFLDSLKSSMRCCDENQPFYFSLHEINICCKNLPYCMWIRTIPTAFAISRCMWRRMYFGKFRAQYLSWTLLRDEIVNGKYQSSQNIGTLNKITTKVFRIRAILMHVRVFVK